MAGISVDGGAGAPPPLPADGNDAGGRSAPASIKGRAGGGPKLKANSQTQRRAPATSDSGGSLVKGRARVLGGESGGIDASFKA